MSAASQTNETRQLPMLTSVLVVCRECLSSGDEVSLLRVESIMDECLNTFSSRYKVWQACRLGLPRRALEYLAAHDPDWNNGRRIAENAAITGYLHVIEWVGECYPDRTSWNPEYDGSLMDIAAEFGHLSILQWLHVNRSEGCTTNAMDRAAAVGHLEIVKWLHKFRGEGCTKQAMNDAAEHGHLAVLEWLHANRSEGCNKSAITNSAENGHLAVVRFLLENRREVCAGDAMCHAAANGHLELVQWIYVNRGDSYVGAALRFAAEKGQTAVVEWLYWIVHDQRRGIPLIREAAQIALKAGHTKVARQLEQKLQRPQEADPAKKSKRRRRR